jgi:hypothetical protein
VLRAGDPALAALGASGVRKTMLGEKKMRVKDYTHP